MAAAHDPSSGIAFVNGEYLPLLEATIPLLDRGFTRSDVTYDVIHVKDGRFFRLDDYVERFQASIRGLRMSLDYSKQEIIDVLTECVRRSGLRDAYVQMTCTRGVPSPTNRDPRLCKNRFYAFAQPFVWLANEEQRRIGLKMVTSSIQRIPSEAVDQRIKNFHWLDLTMATYEAYDHEANYPVLLDASGNVTEGPGFNIFGIREGILITPDHGVFHGMTRRTVLELAEREGLASEIRPIGIEELRDSDEIFLTSTAGGVMPVTTLDERIYGNGSPGPLTRRLADLYWRAHEEGPYSTFVDYEAPQPNKAARS
ncbi:MAG: aminotransferase class IV [Mesorhizobium sp.]